MRKSLIALAAAATLASAPAHAWGQTGHRVIGKLADSFLTTEARRGIAALIENESLAEASTWADFMRASPEVFWQEEASPWHYVTVPEGTTYAEVGPPPEGDAITALARMRAEALDTSLPRAQRQRALRIVIHIVGDLHQPLHAGNGTDRGGNDVRVEFFGDERNLHSIWDSGLIDRQQLSYSEWARWTLRSLAVETAQDWYTADPLVWVGESAAIRDTLYPAEPRISWDYAFQHDAILKQRLAQGGVRLAAYLNAMFGDGRPNGIG
ncbi:MAG: S1/P1 nuclease [Pacificimonas sp.]